MLSISFLKKFKMLVREISCLKKAKKCGRGSIFLEWCITVTLSFDGTGEGGRGRKASPVLLRSGEKIKMELFGKWCVCRVALVFFCYPAPVSRWSRRRRPPCLPSCAIERKRERDSPGIWTWETIAQAFPKKVVPTIYFPKILLKNLFLKKIKYSNPAPKDEKTLPARMNDRYKSRRGENPKPSHRYNGGKGGREGGRGAQILPIIVATHRRKRKKKSRGLFSWFGTKFAQINCVKPETDCITLNN